MNRDLRPAWPMARPHTTLAHRSQGLRRRRVRPTTLAGLFLAVACVAALASAVRADLRIDADSLPGVAADTAGQGRARALPESEGGGI